MHSSSGGIFTAMSDYVLEQGGAVYGACFDSEMVLRHMRATTASQRDAMRGSKYIQSSTVGIFLRVKQDLKEGIPVMFTGTPCQVAALKAFVGKDWDNLICVDIICHGVPSPEIWHKFVSYIEEKYNGKLVNYSFRNKAVSWKRYSPIAFFSDGRIIGENNYTQSFIELFRYDVCLRPSCTSCRYASLYREGDITIGDFWGIEVMFPLLDDGKGVSAVMVNTDKGRTYIRKIQNSLELTSCTQLQIAEKQPNMSRPSQYSNKALGFKHDYQTQQFAYVLKKYTRIGIKRRILDFVKAILSK